MNRNFRIGTVLGIAANVGAACWVFSQPFVPSTPGRHIPYYDRTVRQWTD